MVDKLKVALDPIRTAYLNPAKERAGPGEEIVLAKVGQCR